MQRLPDMRPKAGRDQRVGNGNSSDGGGGGRGGRHRLAELQQEMSSLQAGWAADKEALQTAVDAATTVSANESFACAKRRWSAEGWL